MRKILILIFLLSLCSCTTMNKSELIGVWKSNEAKTLLSLYAIKSIPQKVIELSKDDLFGHLIVEYKGKELRSYFDNCEEKYCDSEECIETVCTESKKYKLYKILEENDRYFKISYFDEFEKKTVEKLLYREGQCYYVFTTKYNIKEYFCRTKK